MKITELKIVSIIINFLLEQNKESYYSLAKKTQFDPKTIAGWSSETQGIRPSSLIQLMPRLQCDISSAFERFSEFAMKELDNNGISREFTRKIFNDNDKDISKIVKQLTELDITEKVYKQDILGTRNIITVLKTFLSAYKEYFQISEKNTGEESTSFFSPFIHNKQKLAYSQNYVPKFNNLILKFPCNYSVGIILSNYVMDYSDGEQYNYYKYCISMLKSKLNLKMLLFITDVDKETIPFDIQSSLMKDYNLFFEFVSEADLQKILIQDLEIQKERGINLLELVERHRYAQLIFERFMSYLSVIDNEIIFMPYLNKIRKDLDNNESKKIDTALEKIFARYQSRSNVTYFSAYTVGVLLKDICRYSYLSRHTIYYERDLIAKEVKNKKLSLVVEICAPNSLTTCNIIDQCEELLLFTTSYSAYSLMTILQEKTGNQFLPSNVSLRLCHLNPEYMMHQYPEKLNGKVDLLVIGYGAGSQISDLPIFIRYAYNWLSENGILFISLYNKEAVILNKNHMNVQRFESSPRYVSDYWTYALNGNRPLLKKLKAYSPESLKSTYLALFGIENIKISTYPYISALINPAEYSRPILDEIRTADKDFSLKGEHGQLIDAIVHKNVLDLPLDTGITDFLSDFYIQYDTYIHTLAPDSKSFRRSLQEKNVPMSNATLLKTVAIQQKRPKSSSPNDCKKHSQSANPDGYSYVILPCDKKVTYNHKKYKLSPESFVLQTFNHSRISPLTILMQKLNGNALGGDIFIQYKDLINTEYVIMGDGSNTKSIRIETDDFLDLIHAAGVITKDDIV